METRKCERKRVQKKVLKEKVNFLNCRKCKTKGKAKSVRAKRKCDLVKY